MGIQDLCLKHVGFTSGSGWDGVLVRESEDNTGPRDIRLVWSTEYGEETHDSWAVTARAAGYEKGRSFLCDARAFEETFPHSECHMEKPDGDDGRVWWSHDLDVGDMLAWLAGPTRQWLYSTRVFDQVELTVSVQSIYKDPEGMGAERSETAWATVFVGFCPTYSLDSAYYDADDKLVILYHTSWTRKDDRWRLEDDPNMPGGGCLVEGQVMLAGTTYGSVAAIGRIEVPGSALTRHVAGKPVYLNVRFNPAYRPIDLEFYRMTGDIMVEDRRQCSTPGLRVVSAGETVEIATFDTHDREPSSELVTIRMVGSRYSVDSVTVAMGETASFRFAPLGSAVEFEAVGSTWSGAVSGLSERVSARTAGSSSIVLDAVAADERVRLGAFESGADVGPSVSVTPQSEVMKLAGRSRPSAYYGEGATATVSFSAVVFGDDATDVEAMAEAGDVMCRFPDGRRYCIVPTVKVARRSRGVVSVTVTGSEVGG